jgi:hypothetical protein
LKQKAQSVLGQGKKLQSVLGQGNDAEAQRHRNTDRQEVTRQAEGQVVVTERGDRRRTNSEVLTDTHHFVELTVRRALDYTTQLETTLCLPPFARLQDVLTCAQKEATLFPPEDFPQFVSRMPLNATRV